MSSFLQIECIDGPSFPSTRDQRLERNTKITIFAPNPHKERRRCSLISVFLCIPEFSVVIFSDRLDENEHIIRFSYNNHVRDSVMPVSPEKAIQLYEAYLTIGRMLRDPVNQIEHKMVPGDMVTFNNSRVLHGRSSFKITEASNRYLQGFYLDWDTIYSRMRVLAKRFNIPFGL